MSFRMVSFAGVTLPGYAYSLGSGIAARTTTGPTIGGFFDQDGGLRARRALPYRLPFAVTVYESGGVSALGAALDDLRALVEQRDYLVVDPMDATAANRWALARLAAINYQHGYQHRSTQPVELVFDILSSWNGTAHDGTTTDNSEYLFGNGLYLDDASPTSIAHATTKTITVTNGGNYPVDNLGLTVTAAGVSISTLKVACNGLTEFSYVGTIQSASVLTVDSGRQVVLVDGNTMHDGADTYANFSLTANHTLPVWLRLYPGTNTIVFTWDNNGANTHTALFTFSDGWA